MAAAIPDLVGRGITSSVAIREALAERFQVTRSDRAEMRGPQNAFNNEVAWAIVKNLREGQLVKPNPAKFDYRLAA